MKITTKIQNNTIRYKLEKEFRFNPWKTFTISYLFDVSKFPMHLANFMVGMLLSEQIGWSNHEVIELGDVTQKELDCINDHVRINFLSNPYKRVYRNKCPIVIGNIVEEFYEGNEGPVICTNGMGKDGLTTALLVKELGFDQVCYTVGNQYRSKQLWRSRVKTMKSFYKAAKINKVQWVGSSFMRGNKYKIIIWQMFAFPIAWYYKSNTILVGFNLGDCKLDNKTNFSPRPNVNIFSYDLVSKASGINITNPFWCISHYGTQKLLIERYTQFAKYQRSCMRGSTWCGKCGKCLGISDLVRAAGQNPTKFGFPNKPTHMTIDNFKKDSPLSSDVYWNAELKIKGRKYDDWIEKINLQALQHSWKSSLVFNIFDDHLESSYLDPGVYSTGYKIKPSEWNNILTVDNDLYWRRNGN